MFLLRIPVAIWLILFVALAAGVVVLTLAFASVRSRSLTPRLAYLAEEADEADRAAEERGLGRGELADEADRLRDQLDRADQGVEALGKEVAPYVRYDRAVRAHDKARRYYDRVRADYEAAQTERRLRLLRRNWRDLNGRDFELFIREVFDCLGYATELTAKTGDQGIDVIATKDGVRWGIQCKGYADAVGNGPVQEAVAGLKFYRCHRAIVVTTSHFTSGGLALAKVNECLIVEGRDIPALIRGEIRF